MKALSVGRKHPTACTSLLCSSGAVVGERKGNKADLSLQAATCSLPSLLCQALQNLSRTLRPVPWGLEILSMKGQAGLSSLLLSQEQPAALTSFLLAQGRCGGAATAVPRSCSHLQEATRNKPVRKVPARNKVLPPSSPSSSSDLARRGFSPT